MKKNHRHCEERAQRVTKQSNKKFFQSGQVNGFNWIASSSAYACATARLLAMTSFLLVAISPTHARVCVVDSTSPQAGDPSTWGAPVLWGINWTVSWDANNPDSQKVMGLAMCSVTTGTRGQRGNPDQTWSSAVMSCWCRMTYPRVGAWIFHATHSTHHNCRHFCTTDCQVAIMYLPASRAAILAPL